MEQDKNGRFTFCYLEDYDRGDLEAMLSHREIEFKDDMSDRELVRLLQDNDQDYLDDIYKKPCPDWCCPPDDENTTFGCETCHPHYFYSVWERITYYVRDFGYTIWFSLGLGFGSGGSDS